MTVSVVPILDVAWEHFDLRKGYGKVIVAYLVEYMSLAKGDQLMEALACRSGIAKLLVCQSLVKDGVGRLIVVI